MEGDDIVVEAAELLVARQTDLVIAEIRAGLDTPGRDDCIVCGGEIGVERRRALPSATRCVRCQGRLERRGKA